jgi:hypothetical protein
MSLEQKIAQLHGAMETIDIYAITAQAAESGADMDQLATQIRVERHVAAIDELGIPRFRITNGPVGVGMGDGTPSPPATSLPMTIGLAAGFDPDLAYAYGDIIGSETATLGQHVLEGPGVCLHRTTIAGRNFEYFSEDPYLSGVMGVAVTKAIQAHDVIAMGKHYVMNDQEYERFRTASGYNGGPARPNGRDRRRSASHQRPYTAAVACRLWFSHLHSLRDLVVLDQSAYRLRSRAARAGSGRRHRPSGHRPPQTTRRTWLRPRRQNKHTCSDNRRRNGLTLDPSQQDVRSVQSRSGLVRPPRLPMRWDPQ